LGVVFILELAAGIASYVLRNEVEAKLKEHAGDGMDLYNKTGSFGVTAAWDGLQRDFKCCGLKTYTDWNVSAVFTATEDVPDSCCIAERKTPGCGKGARKLPPSTASQRIYTDGCLDKLKTWVMSNIAIVGGVGCGVAFIQVFGIICACCLAQSMRKDYENV
jgi:CD63 antigen